MLVPTGIGAPTEITPPLKCLHAARRVAILHRFAHRTTAERMADKTLFEKIIDREIPADIVHEDDRCIAFRDINPQAPTHILVVPRKPIPGLDHLEDDDAALVGHLFVVARQLAEQDGLSGGYRTVFNCGDDAGQTVPHLHLHLLGGRSMTWPPG